MKFLYEYRTSDNVEHSGVIAAPNKDAAFAMLKAQGIRASRVTIAPGFFNKLLGRGKRWLAIVVLGAGCLVLGFFYFQTSQTLQTSQAFQVSTVRRQLIGDTAVIEKGVRTGWADVFEREGDRFLASFAIPGAAPAIRTTTEERLREVLEEEATSQRFDGRESALSPLEARQIRAIVAGMKAELRTFLADGGTLKEYGLRLVERQEEESRLYAVAKQALDLASSTNTSRQALLEIWEEKNDALRRLGLRTLPYPEEDRPFAKVNETKNE